MINKIIDEFYIRVEPSDWYPGGPTSENTKHDCQRIMDQIKRHVDEATCILMYDSHYECSFCGYELADETDYGCCNESEEERESKNSKDKS